MTNDNERRARMNGLYNKPFAQELRATDNDRDALIELLNEMNAAGEISYDAYSRLFDAAEATRPRVVETVDQLEALPMGTIVRGGDGCAHERFSKNGDPSTWFVAGLSDANRPPFPATVLFTPEGSEAANG